MLRFEVKEHAVTELREDIFPVNRIDGCSLIRAGIGPLFSKDWNASKLSTKSLYGFFGH